MSTSASSQRAVFYRSPSGLLYSTPRAVLAHMRNEGSYTRDQVHQFRVEVERWQNTRGKAKEAREGWEEQQANIYTSDDPPSNDNMKKKIIEALFGGRIEMNKKQNIANKASELENVLKSLKAKKTKSSKRKTEGNELIVGRTSPERKRVKMSSNMPLGNVNHELEQKQSSPLIFNSPSQCKPVLLDNATVSENLKQFQCNICEKGYSHKRTLLKHVKIKHRENETSKNDIAAKVAPHKRGDGQVKKQNIEDAKNPLPKNVHTEINSLALKIRASSPMSLSQNTCLPKGLSEDSSLHMIWRKDSSLPQGWSVATNAGRLVYREPGGRQLEGRVKALAHMLELGSAPEEMFQLWSSLGEEGWVVEDSLPTGWRKRTKEGGDEEFLSPMMEMFPRNEAFFQFVLSGTVNKSKKY